MSFAYSASAIIIVAVVTGLLRGLPFLVFNGKKELPETVKFLGNALPPAIMIILVIFSLRNTQLAPFPNGLAEIISVGLVIIIHYMKRNVFLSIFIGTVVYMVLIRIII